jgi:hypothetical protein
MRTTIWITYLSVYTLLKIFASYRLKTIDKIIYLNNSYAISIILTLLDIVKLRNKFFKKIDGDLVGGPELNYNEVFGENSCLVIKDILRQVVRLRRKITKSVCFDKDIDIPGLYDQPDSRPFLRAFFETQIAKDINCAVYFANYIKWLESKSTCETGNNILILTWIDWGKFLKPHLGALKIKIWLINYEKHAKCFLFTKIIALYLLMWVLALKQYFVKSFFCDAKQKDPGNVNDNYSLQKDRLLKIVAPNAVRILPQYQNYLPWLWDSNIKRDRVVVLVPEGRGLSNEEYVFAESSGIDVIKQASWRKLLTSFKNKSSIKRKSVQPLCWNPTDKYPTILIQLLKTSLALFKKVLFHANSIEVLWQLFHFINSTYRVAYYKDFYLSNNIIIDIGSEDSEEIFLRALAMDEIGGILISWERTIRIEYFAFIHNKPVHVEFLTGDYSTMTLQEKTNARYHFKSGWINDYLIKNSNSKEIESIRMALKQSDRCLSIALFDEIWGPAVPKSVVEDFYRKFLVKIIENPDYRLIVKTKKIEIINGMGIDIQALLKEAEGLGRCVVLDPSHQIYSASRAADITVTLPCTAVFESILSQTRTLIFNYGRVYTEMFYQNNGLGRIIFEDLDELISAIDEYAGGSRPDLGDCSGIVQKIDPFRDGNAGKRVGNYMNCFMEGINNGLDRDNALNMANKEYNSMAVA